MNSSKHQRLFSSSYLAISLLACAAAICTAVHAADINVTVTNVQSTEGFVGCALFPATAAETFPLDLSKATPQRAKNEGGVLRCTYSNLPAGSYAVSAAHDVNGNGKPDKNFLGIPTEPWAVSNNVRPTLRPPKFAEAAFTLTADEVKNITLRVAQ
jgi:uncharacterized protein (DUF2141 family)